MHYSTPTCFLRALSNEKRTWPMREGDFMSYAHRAHAFWTGFYTSRPGIKFYERSLGALYQVSSFLSNAKGMSCVWIVSSTIEHLRQSCEFSRLISTGRSDGFIAAS